jgi:hypothetical protein
VGFTYQPFPRRAERRAPPGDGLARRAHEREQKIPQLRNLYERTGFNLTQLEATAGFGYVHDGAVDSVERFVDEPVFDVTSDQQTANLVAFLMAFSGGTSSLGSPSSLLEPPGRPARRRTPRWAAAHAGRRARRARDRGARLDGRAGRGRRGRAGGEGPRGGDRARLVLLAAAARSSPTAGTETITRARRWKRSARPGSELTFTVVPKVSEQRIGVDRDSDSWFDRDELDWGSDPTDPQSRPKLRVASHP